MPNRNSRQQADAIAFLSDPASHGQTGLVDRVDTHANIVFLVGDHGWKIKRAVRLPYLDFSTLENRHAACRREVDVNRRFAPDIYLDCVPIVRRPADGGLALGGTGEVVEWAVKMRRFPQSALLSHVASAGPLRSEIATGVADTVFDSHVHAERRVSADGAGPQRRLLTSLAQSLQQKAVLPTGDLRRFAQRARDQLDAAANCLDERAVRGYVRRCHGDIHLANIVLWQGHPRLYDAIEFDEEMATIDTLYDLAFLLMDLERYGQRRAGNEVLNHYLYRGNDAHDLAGLRALPLFLGLRAAVRAMVSFEHARLEPAAAGNTHNERGHAYFAAAQTLLAPRPPRLFAVGGRSGTGKTTLAAGLAPTLGSAPGAVHIRSDLERKALFKVEATVRLGATSYSPEVNQGVYAALRNKARLVLAAGHSVIVDAVFANTQERCSVEAVAAELQVPFRGLWLDAEPPALMSRVANRKGDASDATADVVRTQLALDRGALSSTWTTLDANGPEAQVLARASSLFSH